MTPQRACRLLAGPADLFHQRFGAGHLTARQTGLHNGALHRDDANRLLRRWYRAGIHRQIPLKIDAIKAVILPAHLSADPLTEFFRRCQSIHQVAVQGSLRAVALSVLQQDVEVVGEGRNSIGAQASIAGNGIGNRLPNTVNQALAVLSSSV